MVELSQAGTAVALSAAAIFLLLAGKGLRVLRDGFMPSDLRSLYFAGLVVGRGGDIYDQAQLSALAARAGVTAPVWPYLYPPPLAYLVAPLARLGAAAMARVWFLLSAVAGLIAVVLSMGVASTAAPAETDRRRRALLPLVALGLCLILPFANNLRVGQVNLMVLLCIASALRLSLGRHRDLAAGLLLAPAATVKVTPLGLLVFFILSRHARVVYGCLAGIALLVLPTVLLPGATASWARFFAHSHHLAYGGSVPGLFEAASLPNFSLAGWLSRLLPPGAVLWASTALALLLGAALVWQHGRLQRRASGALLLGPYLILMVIASPLTYLHHVVYICPGLLATAWSRPVRRRPGSILLHLGLLALAGLASIDFPVLYERLGVGSPLLTSLNLYALLGLFVMGLVLAVRTPGRPGSEAAPA